MKQAILRPAQRPDLPEVEEILLPWLEDPRLRGITRDDRLNREPDGPCCTVLEMDGAVRCVSIWASVGGSQVELLALGSTPTGADGEVEARLLREEIFRWTRMGVSRVVTSVPKAVAPSVVDSLKKCGFLFEGISAPTSGAGDSRIRLVKYSIYKTIAAEDVLELLQDFMVSLGYDVRPEEDGFRYRLGPECRFPFIFNHWHRISRSGTEIIVQPPARVLGQYELETLFFPLRIHSPGELPLLAPLERRNAERLIHFPLEEVRQQSLFNAAGTGMPRSLGFCNVAYSYPAGNKKVRRGLPILFYVNRLGAVGTARAEEITVLDAKDLGEVEGAQVDDLSPAVKRDHKIGKVLQVRFEWYQPLKRVVTLDEIRSLDERFNPQRMRTVSNNLFQAILDRAEGKA